MSNFDIGATVKTSFLVAKAHWKTAFSISRKPLLVILAVIIVNYILQGLLLTDSIAQGLAVLEPDFTPGPVTEVSTMLLYVNAIVGLVALAAFALNWQSFLILDRDAAIAARDRGVLPDYVQGKAWWLRFAKYIIRSLLVIVCPALMYIPLFKFAISLEGATSLVIILLPLLLFTFALVVLLYISRTLVVFPMVAGGAKESGFMAAFALTRGLGLHIFLTQFGILIFLVMVLLFALALVAPVLGILGLMLGLGGLFLVAAVAMTLTPFLLAAYLVITGSAALIYMQLVPEHAARWAEVSGRAVAAR